ncbi:MAG TPA: hypothetical protein PLX89_27620, partial [Verrucomicrobiota bacterium]|nr:hypothetical protein [Verrucomicrobiota bacterium]
MRNAKSERTPAGLELPRPVTAEIPRWPRSPNGRLVGIAEVGALSPIAFREPLTPGVVLDYTVVNTTANMVFDGATTYYVPGQVSLSTTVKFNAGTVIKFANTNAPTLNVLSGTAITWLGAPYRPVVLTSRDDNSLGEPLPGASGVPANTYAATALTINGGGFSSGLILSNLCVRHAGVGVSAVQFGVSAPLTIRHAQFVQCGTAMAFQLGHNSVQTYFPQNVLVVGSASTGKVFGNLYYAQISGEYLTVDGASTLRNSPYSPNDYSSVSLANSLLVSVGSSAGVTLANSPTPPANLGSVFASGTAATTAGAHYLRLSEAPIRSWFDGYSTLAAPSPSLKDDLNRTTVVAPALLPTTVNLDSFLSGTAIADSDLPGKWLGYHYWPIHYASAGATVANATLTLTNGVVLGMLGNPGIVLGTSAKLVSAGRPDQPNRLCWASAVQELPTGSTSASTRNLVEFATVGGSWPEFRCRFTQADMLADTTGRRRLFSVSSSSQSVAVVVLRDCQFRGVSVDFSPVTYGIQSLTMMNNLWENCWVGAYRNYPGAHQVSMRHNLFRSGSLTLYYYYIEPYGNPVWTCTDNLFDATGLGALTISTNYLFAGWNGYSASSATFGGNGNKVSIVPVYLPGPLGSYYYPTTGGNTTLNILRNAGSQTASAAQLAQHTTTADLTKDTGQADIGFHYIAGVAGLALDSDQDGLPDWVEDADWDGTKDATETDPTKADGDGDGNLDGEEIANGTNPLDRSSWFPKRLASWWWDNTVGDWRVGGEAQVPIQTATETPATGAVGIGAHLVATSANTALKYAVNEAGGRPNLRFDQGSIRLWLKPDWSWANHPAGIATLLEIGQYNTDSLGWWAWLLEFDTPNNQLWLDFGQSLAGTGGYPFRYRFKIDTFYFTTPGWHEFALTYDSHYTRSFYRNKLLSWTDSAGNKWFTGQPVSEGFLPTSTAITEGFRVGQNRPATSPANSIVDSLEIFNYPLSDIETQRHQQLTIKIVADAGVRRLQFVRNYQGAKIHNIEAGWAYPSALTLWRRPRGSSDWGSAVLSTSTAESWTDPNVVVGTIYEYKASMGMGDNAQYRHFIAGIEMPPQHQRGKVLLLVDDQLAPSLTTELAQLRESLVGDGWMVTQPWPAPRHDDDIWANNDAKRTSVENWIADNDSPGIPNVIFLIGHVVIPYSGFYPPGGHADGQGASVADVYYGYLDKSLWTDTANGVGNIAGAHLDTAPILRGEPSQFR